MKIDTKDLVRKSERFALDLSQQISQIRLKPFLETSFHCSEFRDKKVLKNISTKLPKAAFR